MTADETVRVGSAAAWSSHWEVSVGVCRESRPGMVNWSLGELVSLNWHTGESLKTLETRSTRDTIVVLVELGVGLLVERSPPSTSLGSGSGPGVESIAPLDDWESVIDVDTNPLVLGPEVESEGTRVWICAWVVDFLGDSVWLFSNSSERSEEPAVTNLTLLDTSWCWLADATPHGHALSSVDLSWSLPSNDSADTLLESATKSHLAPVKGRSVGPEHWVIPWSTSDDTVVSVEGVGWVEPPLLPTPAGLVTVELGHVVLDLE